jgi:signal transduction histidine kinase
VRSPNTEVALPLTESQVHRRSAVGRLARNHPWTAHAGLVVAVLLLGVITAALAVDTVRGSTVLGLYLPGAPVERVVTTGWLVGTVLGAAVLPARNRWPLAVTGVLTVLAVVSLGTSTVLGVLGVCLAWALHGVAARHSTRTAWATGAVVLVVVSAAVLRWQDIGLAEMVLWSDQLPMGDGPPARQLTEPEFSSGRRFLSLMLLATLLVLGGTLGAQAQARRQHARDLVERYAALARERDTSAALARSAERARIAREMHDVVAHSVSVMVALGDGALSALDRAPDLSREALTQLSATGRNALQDMRSVLGSLDPEEGGPATEFAPTSTDLPTVVERFRTAGLTLTTSGLDTLLPADTAVRLAVVRIVTEGLTNVLRHAPGTPRVSLSLRRNETALTIDVVDAGGTRPRADAGAHRGLIGMRERAALLGGHVEAGPTPSGGWRVHVDLPLTPGGTA